MLIGASCAGSGAAGTALPSSSDERAASTTSTPSGSDDATEVSAGFSTAPSNGWRLGVDYVGTSLEVLDGSEPLDASTVTVSFSSSASIGVRAGGCPLGSGRFELTDDGAITRWERVMSLRICHPDDPMVHDAVDGLMWAQPQIRAADDRLLIVDDRFRLELVATGPGIEALIADGERFLGAESSIVGVEPDRLQLTSRTIHSIDATTPTCVIRGRMERATEPTTIDLGVAGEDDCEHADPADRAAAAFLRSAPSIVRSDDDLFLTSDVGTISFRLATDADPVIEAVPNAAPQLVHPEPLDRAADPEVGRISQTRFPQRAGRAGPGSVDLPVPEEWSDSGGGRVGVAGRGEMTVEIDLAEWPVELEPGSEPYVAVGDPAEIEVALHEVVDGVVVETGATATVLEYRFTGDGYARRVVWVLERPAGLTVVTVTYPEFPDDSVFGAATDDRDRSLTGLEPGELLRDVRFFG